MLKKINIMLLMIAIILTSSSCEDEFLENSPTDAISQADALATTANMKLILNGLHRFLYAQPQTLISGTTSFRSGNHYFIPLGDNIPGGVIHTAPANNLGWQGETRWTSHTQETSNTSEQLWFQRYHVIGSVNNIIDQIENSDFPDDGELREILGQAYTYRAWAYHSLVTHYAKGYLIGNPSSDPGVPILLKSESPFSSAPRSSVEDVYTQALNDIDRAIDFFDGANQRCTGDPSCKSQLNIDVAYGVKARIALNKGEWQTAIDAAKKARENFPLMGEDDYKKGFNSNNLPEVIWGSNVITTETVFFRSYFYLMSNTFNGSQVRNNPKIIDKRLFNKIPDTDYRQDLFLPNAPNSNFSASNGQGGFGNDPNFTDEAVFDSTIVALRNTYGWTSRHNTHPFMHVKFKQKVPGGIEPDDIIYMRTSEMYLIEAEAEAMLNNISNAQDALKTLVEERDSAYDVTAFSTQQSLMEEIKFQRKLELWGEGFLYSDKIRWDEGVDHAADGGSGASEILYQDGFFQEKPSVNDEWIFKIPQREIDANPNIGPGDQN